MKMTNLAAVTNLNEMLRERGAKGLAPRHGKSQKDKTSGAHARRLSNGLARASWENACGGNTSAVPHPSASKAGGKRNPPASFKAPRKAGKRRRN
jgi:hypothetical protein